MTRKSPVRHKVRRHIREGKPVDSYIRGKGEHKVKVSNPQIGQHRKSVEGYRVQIVYPRTVDEVFTVNAGSYPEAIKTAFLSRVYIEPPLIVEATKI